MPLEVIAQQARHTRHDKFAFSKYFAVMQLIHLCRRGVISYSLLAQYIICCLKNSAKLNII